MLLDTNVELTFTSMFPAGGVETGILSLPHNSGNIPDILDVQHRVLGWAYAYAVDAIASDLQGAREQMILSKRAEDNVSVGVWRAKIDTLFEQEQRLRGEYVTTALVEGITLVEHKQALPDITVLHRFQWWV